ncbi:hypothetical protein CDAR_585931 [Caerostris darwini]|uniref:Uncharacterized protein n=1 Tax=Caerostris darwini TaxID=1538125 RepID=A0AAV4TMQ8_9ARAC|nr:hypothetical protein CDAR_585931 [Caerostris darwini]
MSQSLRSSRQTRTALSPSSISTWEIKKNSLEATDMLGDICTQPSVSLKNDVQGQICETMHCHAKGINFQCPINQTSHETFVSKADSIHLCRMSQSQWYFDDEILDG